LAGVIYEYHQLKQTPRPAELMLVFGTNDLRVAEHAAELYAGGFAPELVLSGGVAHEGDLLETGWDRTEAEMYAEVAARRGVPRAAMRLETRARNTAENIRFTRELVGAEAPKSLLLVMKPFMQRRVAATMAVEWPEVPFSVSSPNIPWGEYCTAELPAEKIIPILLGDLQRLWIYAKRGWSAPQRFPEEVLEAYRALVGLGYTSHLLEED